MKFVNPLLSPLAVLTGAIVLVVGVRVAQLPSAAMLPAAALVTTAGASWLKSRQPETFNLDNPELERELQSVRTAAKQLADKAIALRSEATNLLTDSFQLELLATVQYACDRINELPSKIDQLARQLQGTDSLLSAKDLQQQLAEVQTKLRSSSGVAREQLSRLVQSLQRNIQLARQGQDARQAQVVSLSTVVQDSAGVLQELQNRLRHADLTNSTQMMELRSLSNELSSFQENIDLLVAK